MEQLVPSKEQPDTTAKKRKRDALDESDPKLQEFLNVMQASKVSANKLHGHEDGSVLEPPAKKVAALDDDESGDEYQSMPGQPRKTTITPPPNVVSQSFNKVLIVPIVDSSSNELASTSGPGEPVEESSSQAVIGAQDTNTIADDDDWLRKRTNRLLDLADDDDAVPIRLQSTTSNLPDKEESHKDLEHVTLDKADIMEEDTATAPEENVERSTDSQDAATLDAIRKTSRIFCRNLPYDATAEDLRTYFEKLVRWKR